MFLDGLPKCFKENHCAFWIINLTVTKTNLIFLVLLFEIVHTVLDGDFGGITHPSFLLPGGGRGMHGPVFTTRDQRWSHRRRYIH